MHSLKFLFWYLLPVVEMLALLDKSCLGFRFFSLKELSFAGQTSRVFGAGEQNMTHSKSFATERSVDFYIDFIGWSFWKPELTLVSSWLTRCAIFSCASFWRHQSVSDVMDRTPEALSFTYRSRKKCRWIVIISVTDFISMYYLCEVNLWLRIAAF